MDNNLIGGIGLLAGAAAIAVGFFLKRKFEGEANYGGIGSFRVTAGGVKWFAGYLLLLLGISLSLVSAGLLFL